MKRRVAREEWQDFVSAFSRTYDGWLISVSVRRPLYAPQYLARNAAFRGLTLEREGNRESLVVNLDGGQHLSHVVSDPKGLFVSESGDGAVEALSIVDALDVETTAEFRSPMPVTAVDGAVRGGALR